MKPSRGIGKRLRRGGDAWRPWTALGALAGFLGLLPAAYAQAPAAGTAVQAWVTTGTRSKLLAPQPGLRFGGSATADLAIDVDAQRRYQTMVGFGAAITDGSAWLLETGLNAPQRHGLLAELFGPPPGIGLSFARLTIGASDFSRSHYSLDDRPPGQTDPALQLFSMAPVQESVLPLVQEALAVNPHLLLMASPWSAPGWMKDNDSLIGGTLRQDAYGPFADYLWRYVDAMGRAGVPIYALTVQNEPNYAPGDYPGMLLDTPGRARLIGRFLGPLFETHGSKTRILAWDHNWDEPAAASAILDDAQAARYVAGIAWHCYKGSVAAQAPVQDAHPDAETYLTECSGGDWMGPWESALPWFVENLIIDSIRGGSKGVLLWNLALDPDHGPHKGGCSDCTGIVTVNADDGTIQRNVEYYVLAHASQFVHRGARRIESTAQAGDLRSVAFRNEDDGSIVLVVLNRGTAQHRFSVRQAGARFVFDLEAHSVATFIWSPGA